MHQGRSSLQGAQFAQAIFSPFDLDDLRQRLGQLGMGPQAGWGSSSKEFLDLVKAIGEAKSKAEEDRIVASEIETLKKRLCEPDVPKKKMKEYLVRLVYVEMLGHSASFGYIHAVKMTHDSNLICKKVGYLAVTLFLEENHDLIILIVNTIRNDLKSDNHLVVCAALTAVCKLINAETIPAVLPQVLDLFTHPKEIVRKKAVMALHRFQQRSPASVSHVISKFRETLCDKDPSVMGASLCAIYDLAIGDPKEHKTVIHGCVSILKQVTEHRLPKNFDYRRVPAPFIQIKLLKILAVLGANDREASQHMYNVLGEVLKKASGSSSNIREAILYECVCTITSIFPEQKLLEQCVEITSRLLKDNNHNLKYLGIDALGRVYKINPDIVSMEKFAVIDCLEDQDETLKRKTLDLLYRMTNPSNVEVIVEKMIAYMRTLNDAHSKTEIAGRVIELVEQFAPSNQWFIQTMNQVFELAGDVVRPSVAHNLMRLIAEGSGNNDEDADTHLRSSAVLSYLQLLKEPKLPSILLQVICWVLGEYGTADGIHSLDEIVGRLCDVAESHAHDDTVRGYVLTAIMKLCAFEIGTGATVNLIPEAKALLEEMLRSQSTDLQQRAYELQGLLSLNRGIVRMVLPTDSSCKEVEVDVNLSFLDDFVTQAVERGAEPYVPESERGKGGQLSSALVVPRADPLEAAHQRHSLRFEAYELPAPPQAAASSSSSAGPLLLMGGPASSLETAPGNMPPDRRQRGSSFGGEASGMTGFHIDDDLRDIEGNLKLNLSHVQKKWGKPAVPPPSHSQSPVSSQSLSHVSSTSGGERLPSSNGAAVSRDPYGSLRLSDSRSYTYGIEKGKKEVVISEEKQRLAASLFGSGSRGDATLESRATGSARATMSRAGAKASKASSVPGPQKQTGPSPGPVPSEAPAPKVQHQPLLDLLDLSDLDVSSSNHAPSTSSDPFKQFETLIVGSGPPSQGSSQHVPPAKTAAPPVSPTSSAFDLLSLLQDAPPPSAIAAGVGYDLSAMMGAPSAGFHSQVGGVGDSGMAGRGVGGAAGGAAGGGRGGIENSEAGIRKGPVNPQLVVQQKVVNTKKAGVTPSGANPTLFKDLLG